MASTSHLSSSSYLSSLKVRTDNRGENPNLLGMGRDFQFETKTTPNHTITEQIPREYDLNNSVAYDNYHDYSKMPQRHNKEITSGDYDSDVSYDEGDKSTLDYQFNKKQNRFSSQASINTLDLDEMIQNAIDNGPEAFDGEQSFHIGRHQVREGYRSISNARRTYRLAGVETKETTPVNSETRSGASLPGRYSTSPRSHRKTNFGFIQQPLIKETIAEDFELSPTSIDHQRESFKGEIISTAPSIVKEVVVDDRTAVSNITEMVTPVQERYQRGNLSDARYRLRHNTRLNGNVNSSTSERTAPGLASNSVFPTGSSGSRGNEFSSLTIFPPPTIDESMSWGNRDTSKPSFENQRGQFVSLQKDQYDQNIESDKSLQKSRDHKVTQGQWRSEDSYGLSEHEDTLTQRHTGSSLPHHSQQFHNVGSTPTSFPQQVVSNAGFIATRTNSIPSSLPPNFMQNSSNNDGKRMSEKSDPTMLQPHRSDSHRAAESFSQSLLQGDCNPQERKVKNEVNTVEHSSLTASKSDYNEQLIPGADVILAYSRPFHRSESHNEHQEEGTTDKMNVNLTSNFPLSTKISNLLDNEQLQRVAYDAVDSNSQSLHSIQAHSQYSVRRNVGRHASLGTSTAARTDSVSLSSQLPPRTRRSNEVYKNSSTVMRADHNQHSSYLFKASLPTLKQAHQDIASDGSIINSLSSAVQSSRAINNEQLQPVINTDEHIGSAVPYRPQLSGQDLTLNQPSSFQEQHGYSPSISSNANIVYKHRHEDRSIVSEYLHPVKLRQHSSAQKEYQPQERMDKYRTNNAPRLLSTSTEYEQLQAGPNATVNTGALVLPLLQKQDNYSEAKKTPTLKSYHASDHSLVATRAYSGSNSIATYPKPLLGSIQTQIESRNEVNEVDAKGIERRREYERQESFVEPLLISTNLYTDQDYNGISNNKISPSVFKEVDKPEYREKIIVKSKRSLPVVSDSTHIEGVIKPLSPENMDLEVHRSTGSVATKRFSNAGDHDERRDDTDHHKRRQDPALEDDTGMSVQPGKIAAPHINVKVGGKPQPVSISGGSVQDNGKAKRRQLISTRAAQLRSTHREYLISHTKSDKEEHDEKDETWRANNHETESQLLNIGNIDKRSVEIKSKNNAREQRKDLVGGSEDNKSYLNRHQEGQDRQAIKVTGSGESKVRTIIKSQQGPEQAKSTFDSPNVEKEISNSSHGEQDKCLFGGEDNKSNLKIHHERQDPEEIKAARSNELKERKIIKSQEGLEHVESTLDPPKGEREELRENAVNYGTQELLVTESKSEWKDDGIICIPKGNINYEAAVVAMGAASLIQSSYSFESAANTVADILRHKDGQDTGIAMAFEREFEAQNGGTSVTKIETHFSTSVQSVEQVVERKLTQMHLLDESSGKDEAHMDEYEFRSRCCLFAGSAIIKAAPQNQRIALVAAEVVLLDFSITNKKDWLNHADIGLTALASQLSNVISKHPNGTVNLGSQASVAILSEGAKCLALERIRRNVNDMENHATIDEYTIMEKRSDILTDVKRNVSSHRRKYPSSQFTSLEDLGVALAQLDAVAKVPAVSPENRDDVPKSKSDEIVLIEESRKVSPKKIEARYIKPKSDESFVRKRLNSAVIVATRDNRKINQEEKYCTTNIATVDKKKKGQKELSDELNSALKHLDDVTKSVLPFQNTEMPSNDDSCEVQENGVSEFHDSCEAKESGASKIREARSAEHIPTSTNLNGVTKDVKSSMAKERIENGEIKYLNEKDKVESSINSSGEGKQNVMSKTVIHLNRAAKASMTGKMQNVSSESKLCESLIKDEFGSALESGRQRKISHKNEDQLAHNNTNAVDTQHKHPFIKNRHHATKIEQRGKEEIYGPMQGKRENLAEKRDSLVQRIRLIQERASNNDNTKGKRTLYNSSAMSNTPLQMNNTYGEQVINDRNGDSIVPDYEVANEEEGSSVLPDYDDETQISKLSSDESIKFRSKNSAANEDSRQKAKLPNTTSVDGVSVGEFFSKNTVMKFFSRIQGYDCNTYGASEDVMNTNRTSSDSISATNEFITKPGSLLDEAQRNANDITSSSRHVQNDSKLYDTKRFLPPPPLVRQQKKDLNTNTASFSSDSLVAATSSFHFIDKFEKDGNKKERHLDQKIRKREESERHKKKELYEELFMGNKNKISQSKKTENIENTSLSCSHKKERSLNTPQDLSKKNEPKMIKSSLSSERFGDSFNSKNMEESKSSQKGKENDKTKPKFKKKKKLKNMFRNGYKSTHGNF